MSVFYKVSVQSQELVILGRHSTTELQSQPKFVVFSLVLLSFLPLPQSLISMSVEINSLLTAWPYFVFYPLFLCPKK